MNALESHLERFANWPEARLQHLFFALLTLAAVFGINPYLYGLYNHCVTVPFVYEAAHPALYPGDDMVGQLAYFYTYFLSGLGWLYRSTGLPLEWIFFGLHILSILRHVLEFLPSGPNPVALPSHCGGSLHAVAVRLQDPRLCRHPGEPLDGAHAHHALGVSGPCLGLPGPLGPRLCGDRPGFLHPSPVRVLPGRLCGGGWTIPLVERLAPKSGSRIRTPIRFRLRRIPHPAGADRGTGQERKARMQERKLLKRSKSKPCALAWAFWPEHWPLHPAFTSRPLVRSL